MKKIAIIAHTLGGGGIEKVVINLANGFIKNNCEVHIILLRNKISYDLPEKAILHLIENTGVLNKVAQIRPYLHAKKIKKILHDSNIDLLISNLTDFTGMKTVDLVNFKNTISVVHNTQSKRRFKRHINGDTFLKKFKILKIQKSYENKDLVCVSDGVKNDLLSNLKIKPKSIIRIYNPFDFEQIKNLGKISNGKIPNEDYIIHVGRFEIVHKRQDVLLKAYKKANIHHKLVLLGDGQDKNKILSLIKELELVDKVILPGFDKNPYNWIKNAKLFVFSSDYEGFGMVLAESLILGTPAISTNCDSGPAEILTGKLSKYLSPAGDIDALASKINEALEYYPSIEEEDLIKFKLDNIVQQYLNFIN